MLWNFSLAFLKLASEFQFYLFCIPKLEDPLDLFKWRRPIFSKLYKLLFVVLGRYFLKWIDAGNLV